MAKRSRKIKTDYKGYGRPHREHRSKKNRRKIRWGDRQLRKQRQDKLEELKQQDLHEDIDNRG